MQTICILAFLGVLLTQFFRIENEKEDRNEQKRQ
jgi:hypothetical protein